MLHVKKLTPIRHFDSYEARTGMWVIVNHYEIQSRRAQRLEPRK